MVNNKTKNLTLKFNNKLVGEISIDALVSKAPIYNRKLIKKQLPKKAFKYKKFKKIKLEDALIKILSSPIIQIKAGLQISMIKWLCVILFKNLDQMHLL